MKPFLVCKKKHKLLVYVYDLKMQLYLYHFIQYCMPKHEIFFPRLTL